MLDLLCSLSKVAAKEDNRREHLEIEAEVDRHLVALRGSLSRVATSQEILRVTEHQFSGSQMLVDAFGASERILKYTWRINQSERLFGDPGWRKHFELTCSLAIAQIIKEIRIALIIGNRNQLDAPEAHKLLEFLASHERLNVKIVMALDYETCAKDNAIPLSCVEFGIYGDQLLYQAGGYTPVSVGSWSKNALEIERFGRFFDAIWNTPAIASNNPVTAPLRVTLSQLMAADEALAKAGCDG